MINHNRSEYENENRSTDHIDTTKIKLRLDMDTNVVNIKTVSLRWCLYVLGNSRATYEAKFMKKLSNTEAELKKTIAYKKVCITNFLFK